MWLQCFVNYWFDWGIHTEELIQGVTLTGYISLLVLQLHKVLHDLKINVWLYKYSRSLYISKPDLSESPHYPNLPLGSWMIVDYSFPLVFTTAQLGQPSWHLVTIHDPANLEAIKMASSFVVHLQVTKNKLWWGLATLTGKKCFLTLNVLKGALHLYWWGGILWLPLVARCE